MQDDKKNNESFDSEEFNFELLDVEGVSVKPGSKPEQKTVPSPSSPRPTALKPAASNPFNQNPLSQKPAVQKNQPKKEAVAEEDEFQISEEFMELDAPSSAPVSKPEKSAAAQKPAKESRAGEDDGFEISEEFMSLGESGITRTVSDGKDEEQESKSTFDDALIQDSGKFEEAIKSGADGLDKAIAQMGSGIGENEIKKEVSFDDFLTDSSKTGQFAAIKVPDKITRASSAVGSSPKTSLTAEMDAIGSEAGSGDEQPLSDIGLFDDTVTQQREAITDALPFAEMDSGRAGDASSEGKGQKPDAVKKLLGDSVVGEISHKGIKQIDSGFQKAREKLNEFFGRSLPEREIALDFKFPVPKSKNEIGEVASKSEIRSIFSQKGAGNLNVVFEKSEKELNTLSKTKMSTSARREILDVFSAPFVDRLKTVIDSYERKPTVPDDPQRHTMVDFCQNAIKHMIAGYKQVYSEIYGKSNLGYGPQRSLANSIAYHLFELVYLEQQLMGCLYKRLAPGSISTVNKLFNVLWLYEPALIDEQRESAALGREISIRQMFLHIQLGVSFDLMCFSALEHRMVSHYLDHHLGMLKFLGDEEVAASTDSLKWVISHDSRDPALIVRKVDPATSRPAMVIALDELFATIKAHYAECLSLLEHKKPVHSSSVLAPRKMSECLSMLGVLNTFVEQIEKNIRQPTYAAYQTIDLSAFAGFKECFMYFRDKNAGREDQRTLKDTLAKRSSFMSEDKDSEAGTMWYCAMEDDKVMYLQTLETRFTVKMDVGWLMLIIRKKGAEEDITLTRIVRMERIQGGKVNLLVEKIGIKAANVTFEPWLSTEATKGQLLPAILTVKSDGKYFVAPNNDRFWKGRQFKIIMPNKKQVPIALDTLQSATHKFQVFKLM